MKINELDSDINDEEMDYPVLPPGNYIGLIESAKLTTTKETHREMIVLEIKVDHNERSFKIWDNYLIDKKPDDHDFLRKRLFRLISIAYGSEKIESMTENNEEINMEDVISNLRGCWVEMNIKLKEWQGNESAKVSGLLKATDKAREEMQEEEEEDPNEEELLPDEEPF